MNPHPRKADAAKLDRFMAPMDVQCWAPKLPRGANPAPLVSIQNSGLRPSAFPEIAVRGLSEDLLAAIPAIHDLMDSTGTFEAQLARQKGKGVNLKDCQH